MSDGSIVVDMFYPHPISAVWSALTRPEALAEWLMPNDFEPRVGHHFTFHTRPDQYWDGVVYCEVIALERPRRLVYTWQNKTSSLDTLVTFTLEPAEGGTRLRLEHAGFDKNGQAGLTIRDMMASGWNSKILRERLPALLDREADQAQASPAGEPKEQTA